MDYHKIYNHIVNRAQNRQIEGYFETHHIKPKCLGGDDSFENLVQLTAREHFLCHILLCEMYPNENKLRHALFLMAIGKQKIKEKKYVIGARVYERLKKEHSEFLTGKKQSVETCSKKSEKMLNVWASKSKGEKKEIGKKRWDTRKKNGTDKVTLTQAQNISKALQGREITWDRKRNTPVSQYTLKDTHIKDYPSISEAERQVGGDIKSAIAGRQKTAAGYIWKVKK